VRRTSANERRAKDQRCKHVLGVTSAVRRPSHDAEVVVAREVAQLLSGDAISSAGVGVIQAPNAGLGARKKPEAAA
jgi:hypothetical protein